MACKCYYPTKWQDPGTFAMCAECEEKIEAQAREEEFYRLCEAGCSYPESEPPARRTEP